MSIMQLNKTIILEKVYTNKMLNDAIKNVVDWKYREDFLSHFILQIANTKEEKLIDLYKKGQLDWFCLRVITNQWKSTNSTFWKIYRNNGHSGEKKHQYYLSELDEYKKIKDTSELDNIQLEYKSSYYRIETKLSEVIDDYSRLDLDDNEVKVKVRKLLLEQYDDFYANQYHKTLFELYYFDKMKLREIAEKTDITIISISRSVRKTTKYIKNKIYDGLY